MGMTEFSESLAPRRKMKSSFLPFNPIASLGERPFHDERDVSQRGQRHAEPDLERAIQKTAPGENVIRVHSDDYCSWKRCSVSSIATPPRMRVS